MSNVYDDPDIPIEVKLNQCFTISLESNPSTGYAWTAEYDFSMIEQHHEQKFKLKSKDIGGGGVELFDFIAKKKGEAILKMKYKRPWERKPVSIKEFTFSVHIE
jgi:inhibitor of cysteine peptidase